jgi:hypothetical protein
MFGRRDHRGDKGWKAIMTRIIIVFILTAYASTASAKELLPCNPNPSDFCYCGYCKGIDPDSHGGVVSDEMNKALDQVSKNFGLDEAIERSKCPKTFLYAFSDPDSGEAVVICDEQTKKRRLR